MIARELVYSLTQVRRRVPQAQWLQLGNHISLFDGYPDAKSIHDAAIPTINPDALWMLSEAFGKHASASWREIAAAMVAVDFLEGDTFAVDDIIWTGPPNKRFAVRRIDQVLYDLISKAEKRVMLVTFAAHRISHLCSHLTAAVNRGVDLKLIIENEEDSQGQLSFDAADAFKNVPSTGTRIYCWPLDRRQRNQAGRPGKLHVKCAVIDDVALIGSANLTDDAFNRNMELGILIRQKETSQAIVEHFQELVSNNILVEVNRAY